MSWCLLFIFFLMIRRPPRSTLDRSSAASDVYKRQGVFSIAGLVLMSFVGKLMGNEFVAAEDRGQFVVDVELPAGTSLDETDRVSALAEHKLLDNPLFTLVYATLGKDGETNKASWRVLTKSKRERTQKLTELKDLARKAVAEVAP